MRNRAGWLALSVLVLATLLMVFFVMPRISGDDKPVGETAGTAVDTAGEQAGSAADESAAPSSDSVSSPEAVPDNAAPSPAETAAVPPATPATTNQAGEAAVPPAPATPAFDVLRVEPDGSTVIAGHAEPGATVEVAAGDAVIASAEAGPSGDFAIVLDKPLAAGDHQLALKATTADGRTIVSEETATVSVPTEGDGKLLAMVTKPGKASRLVAVPTADVPETAAPEPSASQAEEASQAEILQAGAEPPAAATQDAAQNAAQNTPVETAQTVLPDLPGPAADLARSAPPIPPVDPQAQSASQAKATELQITAVEIEGDRIFVAGRADPGASLRGLAGDQMIGTTKAAPDGHFVIEGVIALAVGDHQIAVERLDNAGNAQMRVAVAFNRPPGEQVAAVASNRAPDSVSPIDVGAFDRLRSEADQAFTLLQGLYEKDREPTDEELAAARSATGIALRSLSEYRLPAGAGAPARTIVETTTRQASETLGALEKLPRDAKSVGSGLVDIAPLMEKTVGPALAETTEESVPLEAMAGGDAPVITIEQPPLEESRNSVIIRRGDTLWQISRRVYGQGVRYTTIYLANQDQIDNPDLIAPGQIFGVPDEALPDAEEFHRKRMQQRFR